MFVSVKKTGPYRPRFYDELCDYLTTIRFFVYDVSPHVSLTK